MREEDKYIRFDWAIKRMLRDKANFDVLEGMISVFTGEKDVKILELLESESNQDAYDDKFNRVDIKAKNAKGEIIIVEVQLSREIHYLERMLYGAAKAITEQLNLGETYYNIKKVYSINIIYFDLGKGKDYLYHGQVELRGVHTHDILSVTPKEEKTMNIPTAENATRRRKDPKEIFPEYYLIRVNEFNSLAKTPLEEWMAYLKAGIIKTDTQTPGLQAAREKLQYLMMDDRDRIAYERHMDALRIQNDVIGNAMADGLEEGMKKGMKKGLEEGMKRGKAEGERQKALEIAKNMKSIGLPTETIIQATGLSKAEIESI